MMFIFDRLYGQLSFPPLVKELLDCPGLLRLREVRMANIPFWAFPSFSSVTRYEHSLGVCHLARLVGESLALSEKDRLELMLAGLYHDVATPPFAHAVEEVLAERYQFNHEQKLKDLIIGRDIGGRHAQVFLGRTLKLHKVLQTGAGRELDLDWLRIANLAVGCPGDPLGDLICSRGMDIDNLDNVTRAATSMGIDVAADVAEVLAKSFEIHNGVAAISKAANPYIAKWQQARASLYGMIFASLPDFALQTMLKDAVRQCMDAERIGPDDWCLTDEQLIHERLLQHEASAQIVKRMRLADVYTCLAFLCITDQRAVMSVPGLLPEIEEVAASIFSERTNVSSGQHNVVANYYVDKRKRSIGRPLVLFGEDSSTQASGDEPRIILGIFSRERRFWSAEMLADFICELSLLLPGSEIEKARVSQNRYPDVEGMN